MTVINSNSAALRAQNSARSANAQLQTAMERLSSGRRINSAKDDAAGLAIATTMTAQVRGMNQGIRNANDGISLAQTADGALGEVANMLQRMRELAVQSSSGTYGDGDREKMQVEVNELKRQIVDTTNTKFNGVALFDGAADKVVRIQTGASSSDVVALTISKLDIASATGTVSTTATTAGLSSALGTGDRKIGTSRIISAEDVAYGASFGGATATTADIGTSKTLAAGDTFYQETTAAGAVSAADTARAQSLAGSNEAQAGVQEADAGIEEAQAAVGQAQAGIEQADAGIQQADGKIQEAQAAIDQAQAAIDRVRSIEDDLVIKAPRETRVEYTVAKVGNVLGAGSKVVTLVDPADVYLDIFLPTQNAGQLQLNTPARIVIDGVDAVFPAEVTFVASQAQFTPKSVETKNEREKMMYRVKLSMDRETALQYKDLLKAGMTAEGIVRLDPNESWPDEYAVRLPQQSAGHSEGE